MELDNIKQRTTWNDASASINNNFMKVRQAIVSLQGGGNSGGGGGIDPDDLDDILKEKGYATGDDVEEEIGKVTADIKANPSSYVPLKTINEQSLYGSGNINVGGGGGGSNDLTGYATEEWVQKQGYATKAEIPTKVSDLPNDAKYVTEGQANGKYVIWKDDFAPLQNKVDGIDERVTALEEGGMGGDLSDYATIQYVDDGLADKQDKLVSGDNIKTINGFSILGYGDLIIGDNGGGGAEGLNAINVNGESFQPDGNGIVTLPDYPTELKSPKSLFFGDKSYNGSFAKTISEDDIVSDIAEIRANAALGASASESVGSLAATLENKVDKVTGKGLSTNDYTTAEKTKLASLENYDDADVKQDISTIEKSISDINGDIAGITARVTKAEEDISQNKGDIEGIGEDVTSLMTWYNAVGSKFSKDTDGTIKMEGDFYTTGENSAGGVGESVGGTGGGIDTDELDYILNEKGYATETWVKNQGFATGTIPTRVGQLLNDSGYITSADIPDIPDAYTKQEITELLKGYTTTLSHNTLVSRVTTAEAKITENANGIASNAAKIATNTTNIATNAANISENSEGIRGLDERMQTLEGWWDTVGQYFKYDKANEAWYLDGNFYAKGENSANGAGEDIIDFAEVASRVAANETAIKALSASGPNLVIDFYELNGLQGTNIANAALVELVGMTNEAVNGLLNARYNKVIGNGTYKEVWSYTAYEAVSNIYIYFRRGDGFNTDDWYYLDYNKTTQKWNITWGEI